MKKQLIIITGYSGCGKSTLVKNISETTNVKITSFRQLITPLKYNLKYKRLREYYFAVEHAVFYDTLSQHLVNELENSCLLNDNLIFDGVLSPYVLDYIKSNYDIFIITIYIYADRLTRMQRLGKRETITDFATIELEQNIGDSMKRTMGIESLIDSADYLLDGEKSVENLLIDFLNLHLL